MESTAPKFSPELQALIDRSRADYKKFVSDVEALLAGFQSHDEDFLSKHSGDVSDLVLAKRSKILKFFLDLLDSVKKLDETYKADLKRALLLNSSLREKAYQDFQECIEMELENLRERISNFFKQLT